MPQAATAELASVQGFPGGSASKESACNMKDPSLTQGSRWSLGEENGYPLQYSCLENPMSRVAWWATVHGVIKSWTQLKSQHFHFSLWLKYSSLLIVSLTQNSQRHSRQTGSGAREVGRFPGTMQEHKVEINVQQGCGGWGCPGAAWLESWKALWKTLGWLYKTCWRW